MSLIIPRAILIGNWPEFVLSLACLALATGCGSPSDEQYTADSLAAAGATLAEGDEGVTSLAWQTQKFPAELVLLGNLTSLTDLKLRVDQGPEVASANWRRLEKLRRVELRGPGFGDGSLAVLSPNAPLERIGLRAAAVTDSGLAPLARYATLTQVDLSETGIGDTGMAALVRLPKLEKLNLWKTKVGDEGLKTLAAAPALTWLNVDNTPVTDAGLPHLTGLKGLKYLHLGSTEISDKGVEDLAKMTHLDELIVTRTKLSDDGLARLKAALPQTKITSIYVSGK